MVVDAAFADVVERDFDSSEITWLAGAQTGAPEQLKQASLREFRRAARAAIDWIDDAAKLPRGIVELANADGDVTGASCRGGKLLHQSRAVLLDFLRLVAEQPGDLAQHIGEGWFSVTRSFREISAAPDRLAGGGEEHRKRPAAVLAEAMQRGHVDLVDIRPLLAIYFDIDEQLVHHARGVDVLETLMRHGVAPMAGGVADRQQDRPFAALRLDERLRTPGPPVDRIVLVLQQIGAGFLRETILLRSGGWWRR